MQTRPRLFPAVRAPRKASRNCAPRSAGRTDRLARHRAAAGAACRACPRSIRSSPTLRRKCRRRRRGAVRSWAGRIPADCPAASRVRLRAPRGSRDIRHADRCRWRTCRPPRRRSACLRGSDAGRAPRYQRSLNVPGSPSSMLTAISRGARSARTMRHLRPVGKPAPPETAQPGILHRLHYALDIASVFDAVAQQRVATLRTVGIEVDVRAGLIVNVARSDFGLHRLRRRTAAPASDAPRRPAPVRSARRTGPESPARRVPTSPAVAPATAWRLPSRNSVRRRPAPSALGRPPRRRRAFSFTTSKW